MLALALALWAADFAPAHLVPGAAPQVGMLDLAMEPEVLDALEVAPPARAELGALASLVAEQRQAASRFLRDAAWRVSKPPPPPALMTPTEINSALKASVGPARFERLTRLWAAVRGPVLAADRWEAFGPDLGQRFDAAARAAVPELNHAPMSPLPADPAVQKRLRAAWRAALSPAEQTRLDGYAGREWPEALVLRLAMKPAKLGPWPKSAPPADWAALDWRRLPALLAHPPVLAAVCGTAAARKKALAHWEQALAVETCFYRTLVAAPIEEHAGIMQNHLPRSRELLADLEQAMLAELSPDEQERSWSALAKLVRIGNAFSSESLRTKLRLTKAQSDAYNAAIEEEGFPNWNATGGSSGKTLAEALAKHRVWEAEHNAKMAAAAAKRGGAPPSMERVHQRLLAEIFTPEQRAKWKRWHEPWFLNGETEPALRPGQPVTPPRTFEKIDLGPGFAWK